jgi:O-antigen/teichoic acid export membrane protein
MLQRLVKNTLITALSFFFTGLVPLLLVPLFLRQYGVEQYGVLVLVRLLLPTGVLAVCDLGFPETGSFAVAKARHDGNWDRCGRYLVGLLTIGIGLGLVAAALMAAAEPALARLFSISDPLRPGFRHIVLATALAFPLLLCSLIAEGVLKGFEDFKRLRTFDVSSTFVYAVGAVLAVSAGMAFQWVAYAYLLYGVLRAVMIAVLAWKKLAHRKTRLAGPTSDERRELWRRCAPLGLNRMIGVVQGNAIPVLIGALMSTAAVGVFDLVMRIPRFLKIVTGVLNSAVLPTVLRLDEAGDRAGLQRLMRLGLLGVVSVVTPIVAWGMCFSESLLNLWISDRYAHLWAWQSLMFAWPLINALTSFSCGALLGRPRFVKMLNWIVLGQIVVQIGVSLALVPWLAEKAFIAGQLIALTLSLPFQLGLVFRDCGLQARDFRRHLLTVGVFAVTVAGGLALDLSSLATNGGQLLAWLIGWGLTSGLVVWFFILERKERATLASMASQRLRRKP